MFLKVLGNYININHIVSFGTPSDYHPDYPSVEIRTVDGRVFKFEGPDQNFIDLLNKVRNEYASTQRTASEDL